ncbi:MAG: nuclease-related domain-containing protein [Eubacteriales bacterium]|nr:nuclease-related domain-containing protein [Eubacteriales bacterium]
MKIPIEYLIPIVIVLIGFLCYANRKSIKYHLSPYYRATGKNFSHVKANVGEYGEYIVFNNLLRIKGKKMLLANLYVRTGKEKCTELDVVMIHTSGIYVVESKNYKGQITGYPTSRQWVQSLGRNIENRFYNPIQQNNTHIRALRRVLKCDESVFRSVIAFNDNSDLSNVHTDDDTIITTIRDINRDISKSLRKHRRTLSPSEVHKYYEELNKFSHAKRKVRKEHLKYVTQKKR